MKLFQLVKFGCVASLALVMFTGCASFPKNELPVANMQPPVVGAKKPTVSYSFTSGVDIMGKQEHMDGVRSILEAEFVGVLNDSGYFAAVTKLGDQGDIDIQARLVNSGSPAALIPAFFTGLSLYAIPSCPWAHRTLITRKLKNLDNIISFSFLDPNRNNKG